jgi:hypothetical protein
MIALTEFLTTIVLPINEEEEVSFVLRFNQKRNTYSGIVFFYLLSYKACQCLTSWEMKD